MEVNLQGSAVNAAAGHPASPANSHSWLPAPQLQAKGAGGAFKSAAAKKVHGGGTYVPRCRWQHMVAGALAAGIASGTGASRFSGQPHTPRTPQINMALSLCAQLSSLRVSAQRVSLRHCTPCHVAPYQTQALAQCRAHSALAPADALGDLPPCTLCRWDVGRLFGAACRPGGGAHFRAAPSRPAPCLQAPKPFAAANSLASKVNGIAAAPRPVLAQQKQQQQPAASLALKVECADGPRGMKLKTRKVRRFPLLPALACCDILRQPADVSGGASRLEAPAEAALSPAT